MPSQEVTVNKYLIICIKRHFKMTQPALPCVQFFRIRNFITSWINVSLWVCLTGCCTFDEPLSSCGYSQSDDDDLNWDQVNAPVKPSSGQGMPSGWSLILFCSL